MIKCYTVLSYRLRAVDIKCQTPDPCPAHPIVFEILLRSVQPGLVNFVNILVIIMMLAYRSGQVRSAYRFDLRVQYYNACFQTIFHYSCFQVKYVDPRKIIGNSDRNQLQRKYSNKYQHGVPNQHDRHGDACPGQPQMGPRLRQDSARCDQVCCDCEYEES